MKKARMLQRIMCAVDRSAEYRRVLRVVTVISVITPLIGCPFFTTKDTELGSQSLLQRALFAEQRSQERSMVAGVEQSSQARYNFMLGEIALADERNAEALEYFERAVDADSDAAPTLRLRLAGLYLQEKRLSEALEQLAAVTKADPENLSALQLKAGVLATLGKEQEAIAAYRKLIRLKGASSEEPYIFAASLHLQASQFEEATEILEELLVAHPNSFFANYYLARISEAQSDMPAAVQYYQKALKTNPRADAVRLDLARLYGSMREFAQGVALIDEVIERDPNNVEAKTLRAQLLVGQDQLDEAIDEFEEVTTLEEDPSKTRFRIALIKLQRRDIVGAISDLNLVLAVKPDDVASRYYLASAYASQGRIAEALEQIREIEAGEQYFTESRTLGAFMLQRAERYSDAIDLLNEVIEQKEDPKLLAFLASLQKEAGNTEQAIEVMERLLVLEPDNDQYHFTLGVYHDQSDNRAEAIAAMRKAIEIDPRNASALNYLGYTYAEAGENLAEAQELIERALVIEPDNGYYIDSLGWVLFQSGQIEKAKESLERAVSLVPNDAVILEHLAIVYKELGMLKQAREVAEKALEFSDESDDVSVGGRLKKLLGTLPE